MSVKLLKFVFICILLSSVSPFSQAKGDRKCHDNSEPAISFVKFDSFHIKLPEQQLVPITVQGKLKFPVLDGKKKRCFSSKKKLPAVVILHGSAGIDSRGDFYARALNDAGIATLEIDMWEARGIGSAADRPQFPLSTYPDAFGALTFLSEYPNIDPERIGVLGFSWGAVITMASATSLYSGNFGGGLKFAAHVAHYPICYAYNSGIPGSEFGEHVGVPLTGAPVLIQIGEEDDYDNGSLPCFALKDSLNKAEQKIVDVKAYEEAFHAWDRLQVPFTVNDPYADQGSYFQCLLAGGDDCQIPEVNFVPDVEQAYSSRKKVVKFFRRNF